MEYRNFGTGGVKVSPIALGLGFRGQADPAAAERTIRAAIENGINLIDCANVYGLTDSREFAGTSEKVLSKVLKDHRDDLVVTSKVFSPIGPGPNDSGLSRFHIMREIERTLDGSTRTISTYTWSTVTTMSWPSKNSSARWTIW